MVEFFWSRAQRLGPKLGVMLFQLPPWFRKDLGVLDVFLGVMPQGARAASEFRHESWLDDEVYGRLRDRHLALCITDSDKATTPV